MGSCASRQQPTAGPAHPLANVIVDHAAGERLSVPEPEQYEQLQGRGVKARIEGRNVLVGNAALLQENGVT